MSRIKLTQKQINDPTQPHGMWHKMTDPEERLKAWRKKQKELRIAEKKRDTGILK